MRSLKDIITMLFKQKKNNEPWLDYYSREERSIKFTDKSIYNFMIDSVGQDKDYFALNHSVIILIIELLIMSFLIRLIFVHVLLEVME